MPAIAGKDVDRCHAQRRTFVRSGRARQIKRQNHGQVQKRPHAGHRRAEPLPARGQYDQGDQTGPEILHAKMACHLAGPQPRAEPTQERRQRRAGQGQVQSKAQGVAIPARRSSVPCRPSAAFRGFARPGSLPALRMSAGPGSSDRRAAAGRRSETRCGNHLILWTCAVRGVAEPTLTPAPCRPYNPRPFHIA